MFRLIYQQKQYLDQVTFWADFKQLAEQQLKLPDIQNNKFVLPSLKYIPGNSYKNQNTQNQQKQQKKSETKKRQREELSSEEDTDDSQIVSPESSKIKMITRNKQDQQAIDTSKRKKQ
ncbi:hypothetical protein OXYTRIMIC_492 [Oxytricha trifallax]|uniref:Uncharacterized protein n=1 Tax=Oxytricha trifallax TaxID=1172189 RepID=A0A073HYG2_9SPIT|nr:hypothetical protein OXYTRIMIC_492 [Oxytricha trifallax]